MNNQPSTLVAPKGLRKAVSIVMIVLGAIFLIASIIMFSTASLFDTSTTSGSAAALASTLIAVIFLVEGAFYLIFGIIGLTKCNDGIYHKKLLSVFLLIFSTVNLVSIIISLTSSSGVEIVLYVIEMLLFAASVVFTSLSLSEGKKSGKNEKTFAMVGVATLFGGFAFNSIVNMVATASVGGSIASSLLGFIVSIALYTLYFMYFLKLSSPIEPTAPSFYTPNPYAPQEVRPATKNDTFDDKAETLKKYKALLDDGAITQEEYDKKKEEILK